MKLFGSTVARFRHEIAIYVVLLVAERVLSCSGIACQPQYYKRDRTSRKRLSLPRSRIVSLLLSLRGEMLIRALLRLVWNFSFARFHFHDATSSIVIT